MPQLTITNARIVTPEEVILGTAEVTEGIIVSVGEGLSRADSALDFEGDYLLPGLVELHTDNLEKHFAPRPAVDWPGEAAVLAHDGQLATAGITTVFDAVPVGDAHESEVRLKHHTAMADAVRKGTRWGVFRAEHFLHMRCEVSYPRVTELFSPFIDDPLVRLVSVMDHTPGQRQFVDLDKHREYYQTKFGLSDGEMASFVESKLESHRRYGARHRAMILAEMKGRDITLASHDDATPEHIDEAVRDGMAIAEFPTTLEAAYAARSHGMKIVMGAPNLVLGGSHSGNVSALDLASRGLLDVLSSDYVPSSILHGVFLLRDRIPDMTLPRAAATATSHPARVVGLMDRGEIVSGKRADFIRVREIEGIPIVRATWREGRRVV